MVEHGPSFYPDESRKYIDFVPLSATPGEVARVYLGIPEDVKGMIIVDLCSGFSSLPAQLLAENADVRAVDPIYRLNSEDLVKRMEDVLHMIPAAAPISSRKNLWISMHNSMREFAASYKKFPEHYYAGYLPTLNRQYFPDNFADMTISLLGISGFGENPDLFFQSVAEAIRITKPGCKFVMVPVRITRRKAKRSENQSMMEKISQFGEITIEKNITIPGQKKRPSLHRLTIIKK